MNWDKHYENPPISGVSEVLVKLLQVYCGEFAGKRILELGCGLAPCASYLWQREVRYYGIDSSAAAINKVRALYPQLADHFAVGDFTKAQPFGEFDLIFDRASVAHNDTESIKSCIEVIHSSLKPGGIFIGVDWFSTRHSEYGAGEPDTDELTRTDYQTGQFKGVGQVHFSDAEHIAMLFKGWEGLFLGERSWGRVNPNGNFIKHGENPLWFRVSDTFSHSDYQSWVWDVVVRKPK